MAIKDFKAGQDAPEQNQKHTRTGIQKVIEPALQAALKGIEGLNLDTAEHLRRTVRATVNVAVRLLLDAGAAPQTVAEQLMETLSHELMERKMEQNAEGEAQSAEAKEQGAAPIFSVVKGGLKN